MITGVSFLLLTMSIKELCMHYNESDVDLRIFAGICLPLLFDFVCHVLFKLVLGIQSTPFQSKL